MTVALAQLGFGFVVVAFFGLLYLAIREYREDLRIDREIRERERFNDAFRKPVKR